MTLSQTTRITGMVSNVKNSTVGSVHPTYSYPHNATRSMLQGFYMATPAVDVAWLMNRSSTATTTKRVPAAAAAAAAINRLSDGGSDGDGDGGADGDSDGDGGGGSVMAYLTELETVLVRFDGWLWTARNSSDGVLWLADIADTGEDRSDKYSSIVGNQLSPPFESM